MNDLIKTIWFIGVTSSFVLVMIGALYFLKLQDFEFPIALIVIGLVCLAILHLSEHAILAVP